MIKAVILAGGLGTRLSEETDKKPKPMVTIGGKPILWHIMKAYAHYGVNEFIICCGYKGYIIKEFFANYLLHTSDVSFDLSDNSTVIHQKRAEDWKVTLLDTGIETMTGGRLLAAREYLKNDTSFFFTYGDGLSDINFLDEYRFHVEHEKIATVAGVVPPGRFGSLKYQDDKVLGFTEKPKSKDLRVNGGFFVLNRRVFDFIEGPTSSFESVPIENLAALGELKMYRHDGFWQPMDTLRDKNYLQAVWDNGHAPWKNWNED